MAKSNANIRPTVQPRTRAAWRAWLEKNHEHQGEVWLISDKRHTGRSAIRVEDAIEEALCYGWIDSTIRRIDDETFARKFSRRRPGSEWSQLNARRVRKLIEERRMTPAGLAALKAPSRPIDRMAPRDAPLEPPPDLAHAISRNASARALYAKFPPSARRLCHAWILSAKRPVTRTRRIAEAVERIANNERTLLK